MPRSFFATGPMARSPLPEALDGWHTSVAFVAELSARLPYVYVPEDGGGGGWRSTSDALPDLLGWPPGWEARVGEVQVRADAPCPHCTFLDVHGRDPRHPHDVRGTTVAVTGRGTG